ncbi:MAG TPA: QueT transporter family protein [Oscillospiraceae bacterium]|nr:QueT transporter family protein [Oscillospiraceae bacterium]
MTKENSRMQRDRLLTMVQGAVIASIYMVATFLTSAISFGMIQFRISEALAALAILFPGASIGLFTGCLLANLLNPASLGIVDILGGSVATGVAALLTYRLGRSYRKKLRYYQQSKEAADRPGMISRLIPLTMPVIINALIVGVYLPFLIQGTEPTPAVVLLSVLSIFISQAIAVYALGLPLLLAMERTPAALDAIK